MQFRCQQFPVSTKDGKRSANHTSMALCYSNLVISRKECRGVYQVTHRNLYIVDNDTPERSVKKYLNEWGAISRQMDIATGYFEIGGLLELDGKWQNLKKSE
jgi:hypothetical protein